MQDRQDKFISAVLTRIATRVTADLLPQLTSQLEQAGINAGTSFAYTLTVRDEEITTSLVPLDIMLRSSPISSAQEREWQEQEQEWWAIQNSSTLLETNSTE